MRLAAILVLLMHCALAQSPQVPHKMNFAGITLTLRDDARREIQKDVDALTQYPKYFNIKVERAKTYFPIIEKIFAEERLPDDFKYLVLQESALIPDAVSVSQAVGFWQFKDFTAIEMGLRVDKEIDERMNIASSSRAAAQYLKKNNHFFNNWVYALQAYQMGAGGVMRSVKDYESGAKHMEITSKTYWYVKKFLAHKIAFEGAVKGRGEVEVLVYENHEKKSLNDLAKEFAVPTDQLQEYNKWARKGSIPNDRKYVVAIPVQGETKHVSEAVARANTQTQAGLRAAHQPERPKRLEAKPATAAQADKKFIHGLPAIKAGPSETSTSLAKRAGVSLSFLLACNDLSISDPLTEGQYYYLKKKKTKAHVPQHTVSLTHETLWSVSQQYGIQLKKLKKLNPALISASLKPGTVVRLPAVPGNPVAYTDAQAPQVESGAYFSWSVDPKTVEASMTIGGEEPIEVLPVQDEPSGGPNGDYQVSPAEVERVEVSILPDKHRVLPGETLYAIARQYNIGVMDLVNWNQLKLEEGIKPGQVLITKGSKEIEDIETPGQDRYIVYQVKASDTLYSVARQHGVTIKELMEWNKKQDFNVAAGEKLRILRK
jgi:membrane-bound lytic murein transglycosylase D